MTTPAESLDGAAGVRIERDGPVATVTLSRPDVLNAQTPEMWGALRDIGRNLPGDVRVVVVRGEGRAFSAGLDLRQAGGPDRGALASLAMLPTEEALDRVAGYQEGFTWLGRPDLVSIAAVQGHAIGAGFQLALACDMRILTPDAQLTMAEVTLGLVPDLGGTGPLVRLVGYARAMEICVTGRRVGADEALSIGLANLVVAADELDSAVRDLTAAILSNPRDAVVEVKALLSGVTTRTPRAQLEAEREAQLRRLRDLAGIGE